MCTSLTVIALFLTLPLKAPASNTWYVNGASGNDSNDCKTPTTACRTIGHAISLAASGDSIIVAPATYTETLHISFSLSVIGSGASTTIIDGGGQGKVVSIGGGIQVSLSGLTIRNGYVSVSWKGCCENVFGGSGIYNNGTLTINKSTVSGNTVSATVTCTPVFGCGGGVFGGGIYNTGSLTISNSTVSGNRASISGCVTRQQACVAYGGGIFNHGNLVLNNSTVSGNISSASHAWGGGISNVGTAIISNSTTSGNGGGGISNNQGFSVALQNSIVSSNNGLNCVGTITSNGYNLSSDGTCNFNSRGDLNDHDPLLGPLQNNGGTTDTMALLAGSPAIDAGNPAGCTDGSGHLLTTDQRGMPRPDKEGAATWERMKVRATSL